jgi:hypothetical protein
MSGMHTWRPSKESPEIVTELRAKITVPQREVLDFIWENYLQTRLPLSGRRLGVHFGKNTLEQRLVGLSGNVLYLQERSGTVGQGHLLTLLGVLLTKDRDLVEILICRFLTYVQQQLEHDPDLQTVHGSRFREDTRLSVELTEYVGALLGLNWGWGGSFGREHWSISIPDDVEWFWDGQTPTDAVRRMASMGYDDRMPLAAAKQSEFARATEQSIPNSHPFAFLPNRALGLQLATDWQEANSVFKAKAWKATAVMCGCVFEGLLLGVLHDKQVAQKPKPRLDELIDAAKSSGLLADADVKLVAVLREYRNLIHLDRQMRLQAPIGEDEARIAVSGVNVLLRRIAKEFSPPQQSKSL